MLSDPITQLRFERFLLTSDHHIPLYQFDSSLNLELIVLFTGLSTERRLICDEGTLRLSIGYQLLRLEEFLHFILDDGNWEYLLDNFRQDIDLLVNQGSSEVDSEGLFTLISAREVSILA